MKINSLDNLGYVVTVDQIKMSKYIREEKPMNYDRLEISDKAKKLAQSKTSLTPDRAALIKQRIAENFYDQDEVLKEIANRMLKSNDFRDIYPGSAFDKDA